MFIKKNTCGGCKNQPGQQQFYPFPWGGGGVTVVKSYFCLTVTAVSPLLPVTLLVYYTR